MKSVSNTIRALAAVLCTSGSMAIAVPAAHAGEYCVTNTSGMRGCGYSSLEQCQASVSGLSGTCARDPFYSNSNTSNALAYHPKQARSSGKPDRNN